MWCIYQYANLVSSRPVHTTILLKKNIFHRFSAFSCPPVSSRRNHILLNGLWLFCKTKFFHHYGLQNSDEANKESLGNKNWVIHFTNYLSFLNKSHLPPDPVDRLTVSQVGIEDIAGGNTDTHDGEKQMVSFNNDIYWSKMNIQFPLSLCFSVFLSASKIFDMFRFLKQNRLKLFWKNFDSLFAVKSCSGKWDIGLLK